MLTLKLLNNLADIKPTLWNAWVQGYPFLSHEFLTGLQETGCVSAKTGWEPLYLTLWQGEALVGALPLFLKSHSRGEFVFDHGWADAFERHGLDYYPKLVAAAPFTPVSGPRLLASDVEYQRVLAEGAMALARQLQVSSLHVLFPDAADLAILQDMGFLLREGIQFHWHNAGYPSFEDFLSALNHDKRKKIRQERRRATEAGLHFQTRTGKDIGEDWLRFFYQCYVNTYHEHWSTPYLNLAFFRHLSQTLPDRVLWIFAVRGNDPVASAMNILGDDVLYGRYWGAKEFVSGLHFETCYSQAVEYCIRQGISRFEGGAQGVHKMARGLLPVATWSAHWIARPDFAEAIQRFLDDERKGMEHYMDELNQHTPFKH